MIKPPKNYFTNEFIPKLNIGLIYEDKAKKQILNYYNNDIKILMMILDMIFH